MPELAGVIGTKDSFGVFENSQQQTRLPQVHEERLDDIFKWADKAMYQAKAAGRNQVRFYPVESCPVRSV